MELFLDLKISRPPATLSYTDKTLLIGSCFTEQIGERLKTLKFNVCQNPNGILYDPLSICQAINSWIDLSTPESGDLFYHDELWHSWEHHSIFSGMTKEEVLQKVNRSTQDANIYLKNADWLLITFGSSIYYSLNETGRSVANCHKVPSDKFRKSMLEINFIEDTTRNTLKKLLTYNPKLRVILTVSPVRHLSQGLIQNTKSKARLIEAVTTLVDEFERVLYFPAYELVNDVLRDYRFYDEDLVHPNKQAADFVFDKFIETFLTPLDTEIMRDLKTLLVARKHKPFRPQTSAYLKFKEVNLMKTKELLSRYPFLNLTEELDFFGKTM